MEFKKNYLTMEEIAEIVDRMVEEDFSYNREVIKVSLTAMCCVDYDFEEKTGVEIYNLLAQEDMLSEIEERVTNYYIVDKMVKEDRSIETALVTTLKKAEKMIDKYSKGLPKKAEMESFLKSVERFMSTKTGGGQ